jgi:hypothetical protein
MINFKNKTKNGYAILELLFYISFFVVLSLTVIKTLITMASSFRETAVETELIQSGTILEKMSREIRSAYNLDSVGANDLIFEVRDNNGVTKTEEFVLSGSDLQFFENGVLTGDLNTPKIMITELNFLQITTAKSKAIKISLALRSTDDTSDNTQRFYDTIVLRGSY